ncbi:hypothetical protein EVAR_14446_1 [Eumeta japonica]|uniref:Uncharacterized protein n=1 Tax=Eumeta variegata TaxID=151549 RepID=A0A4C1U351_EUMVA|nr:hypothetical protein EVAR_14446_1 [Eumeta japonica]
MKTIDLVVNPKAGFAFHSHPSPTIEGHQLSTLAPRGLWIAVDPRHHCGDDLRHRQLDLVLEARIVWLNWTRMKNSSVNSPGKIEPGVSRSSKSAPQSGSAHYWPSLPPVRRLSRVAQPVYMRRPAPVADSISGRHLSGVARCEPQKGAKSSISVIVSF